MYISTNQVTSKYGYDPNHAYSERQFNSLGEKLFKSTITVKINSRIEKALPHKTSVNAADPELMGIVSTKPDYAIGAVRNTTGIEANITKSFAVISESSSKAIEIANYIKLSRDEFDQKTWSLVSDKDKRSVLSAITKQNDRLKQAIRGKGLDDKDPKFRELLNKNRIVYAPFTLIVTINVRHVVKPNALYGDWSNEEMIYHVKKDGSLVSDNRVYQVRIPVWKKQHLADVQGLVNGFYNDIATMYEAFQLVKDPSEDQAIKDHLLADDLGMIPNDIVDLDHDEEFITDLDDKPTSDIGLTSVISSDIDTSD